MFSEELRAMLIIMSDGKLWVKGMLWRWDQGDRVGLLHHHQNNEI